MPALTLSNITCSYRGADTPAVDDLTLEVADGEFLAVVGPSGCGKSTTLRTIAGLEQPTSGSIHVGGHDITDKEPRDRDLAMVFQSYALYPHMTVAANMGYSLKLAKVNKAEREERVRQTADLLQLTPYLDRKPSQLSGGQRQRVAMGRAIVRKPSVFLMDEPLSNLDAKLRAQTRAEVSNLTRELGVTTIYVTHDQTEAMTMGDRVAVLNDGKLEQLATPRELYTRPNSTFVAGFIGSPAMNLFPGAGGNAGTTMGIRPEDIVLCEADQSGSRELHLDLVEETGADSYLHGTLALEDGGHRLIVRASGATTRQIGDRVHVRFPENQMHWFDTETGQSLERGQHTAGLVTAGV